MDLRRDIIASFATMRKEIFSNTKIGLHWRRAPALEWLSEYRHGRSPAARDSGVSAPERATRWKSNRTRQEFEPAVRHCSSSRLDSTQSPSGEWLFCRKSSRAILFSRRSHQHECCQETHPKRDDGSGCIQCHAGHGWL